MLSKSLIQFSAEGWGCVPSLLFDLGPNYPRGNEDNGTSFKRSLACTASLGAPNPPAGHHQTTPLPEPPGYSQASLGQSLLVSLLLSLGPGTHKFLYVPSKSLFTQSCVTSGSSMVGLMVTSSKRAYAIPRSAAPRAPAAGHC